MKSKFSIVKNFKIFGIISILLCATGLVALLGLPFGLNLFNFTIDFVGGTEMEFNMHQAVTADVEKQVSDLFHEVTGLTGEVTAAGNSGEQVVIRSTSIDSEVRAEVITKMNETFNLTDDDLYGNEDVSPTVGSDLQKAAIGAAAVAILLMLIYIAFRFEFTSGLAAVTCLVHDMLIMISVFVIFRLPVNGDFIAAVLTILGYSINASIIVFDRVRENLRAARRETFEELAEVSIWQTMGRTINTTLTTMFAVGMIYILGVDSLKQFTLPLLIGFVAGAYSSIFLASSLWGKYRKIFKKHA